MNVTGTNTAMNTRVHDTMAMVTSLIASLVARYGDLYPASNLDCTASTTTMASSTTVPMTSTRANSVRMLMLNPAMVMQANVPTSDTMMDMDGMSVLLKSCRKKYTTRMTSSIATMSVSTTLCMDSKRKSLVLNIVTNSTPVGRLSPIS